MADKVEKPKKSKARAKKDEKGVLAALPSSRPERIGTRRASAPKTFEQQAAAQAAASSTATAPAVPKASRKASAKTAAAKTPRATTSTAKTAPPTTATARAAAAKTSPPTTATARAAAAKTSPPTTATAKPTAARTSSRKPAAKKPVTATRRKAAAPRTFEPTPAAESAAGAADERAAGAVPRAATPRPPREPRPRPVREGAPGMGTTGGERGDERTEAESSEHGRPSGVELVTTAVQAAGELTQVGLTIGGRIIKRAVDRLPKP